VLEQRGRLFVAAGFDVKRAAGTRARACDNGLTELNVGCCFWNVIDEPRGFVLYSYVGRLTVRASFGRLWSVFAEP
jgi:hypothetical protein